MTTRPYTTTPLARLPYKNSQDRESLRPGSTEGTKSARDDEVATEHPDAAFNPDKTSPEEAMESSKRNRTPNGRDGLEASGANQEINKPTGDEKVNKARGKGEEVQKGGTSRGKRSEKKGAPKQI